MTSTVLSPGKLGKLKTRKASDDRSLPSVVIYGGSGTGKTTLAASACEVPEMQPVISLNIENGTQSVKDLYPDMEVVDINHFQELQEAYDALYDGMDRDSLTCAGYKTVILDNITEGQSKGMEHLFKDSNLRPKGGISFTEFVSATFANGGWNHSTTQMQKLIRAFKELPCNVIFVAWEMDFNKGTEGAPTLWTPAFTHTLAGNAPGLVNDVYRLYFDRDGDRALQTNRTRNVVAKDRTRKLPFQLKNPTMRQIHDYWTGTLVKSPEDDLQQSNNGLKRKK
jgi:hypothetical protein